MKVEKTLVGWVVILIVLSIFIGGFAVQLFFFSIICTLGISLIIWIPLGYGVGYIVFAIFGWGDKKPEIKPEEDGQPAEQGSEASPTREQQTLVNYIKKARARGMNDERISQVLTSEDWPTDSIAAAFQMARNG